MFRPSPSLQMILRKFHPQIIIVIGPWGRRSGIWKAEGFLEKRKMHRQSVPQSFL